MPKIELLDQVTIDKIAAGEVVERPASVIKELVENAIDAGATQISIEVEDGGIKSMRICDNGCGIDASDIKNAFLRHSTSKIREVQDLTTIHSLGFRGEALSSISAVAKVELITKTKENELGFHYTINGGVPGEIEDVGATDGTTFMIRQLFYNTPARRKFLKTPMTESSHIYDLIVRLALSHPEIAISFQNQKQEKLHTPGNGKLQDCIYHIFGRDVANGMIPICFENAGIKIKGYIGKPELSRGNRNFEIFYVNNRYVKSSMISKSIEDAYKGYTMQHKFPFVILQLEVDTQMVDVNVHPTKMEVRFSNQQVVYNSIYEGVERALKQDSLIPVVEIPEPASVPKTEKTDILKKHEAQKKLDKDAPEEEKLDYFMEKMKERVMSYHSRASQAEVKGMGELYKPKAAVQKIRESVSPFTLKKPESVCADEPKEKQLDLFQEHLLNQEVKVTYRIVGQVFETYWMIQKDEKLYIIDQHAAHEKVLYEQTIKGMKTREYLSQYISPPLVLNLSMGEQEILEKNLNAFTDIGFELEPFGENAYAVRAVPANLFSIAKKELFIEILDQMGDELRPADAPELITDKIASMSCKAAVKGNMKLSQAEVEHLIDELLTLENPYHCPHGRPTMIEITKKELEKKFKRIVS